MNMKKKIPIKVTPIPILVPPKREIEEKLPEVSSENIGIGTKNLVQELVHESIPDLEQEKTTTTQAKTMTYAIEDDLKLPESLFSGKAKAVTYTLGADIAELIKDFENIKSCFDFPFMEKGLLIAWCLKQANGLTYEDIKNNQSKEKKQAMSFYLSESLQNTIAQWARNISVKEGKNISSSSVIEGILKKFLPKAIEKANGYIKRYKN